VPEGLIVLPVFKGFLVGIRKGDFSEQDQGKQTIYLKISQTQRTTEKSLQFSLCGSRARSSAILLIANYLNGRGSLEDVPLSQSNVNRITTIRNILMTNVHTTPMTPTFLLFQLPILSSHCALCKTFPLNSFKPEMSGHVHRDSPPKPVNNTSAVSSISSWWILAARSELVAGRRKRRCHFAEDSS